MDAVARCRHSTGASERSNQFASPDLQPSIAQPPCLPIPPASHLSLQSKAFLLPKNSPLSKSLLSHRTSPPNKSLLSSRTSPPQQKPSFLTTNFPQPTS